jgi:hypothetical protein
VDGIRKEKVPKGCEVPDFALLGHGVKNVMTVIPKVWRAVFTRIAPEDGVLSQFIRILDLVLIGDGTTCRFFLCTRTSKGSVSAGADRCPARE